MPIDFSKMKSDFRRNTVMRALGKPIMDIRWEWRYQQYLRCPDREKLRALKDTHKGERCFIIGNGPSLRAADLDKLQGEFTFASNRIYEIFDQTDWRPTVYVVSDYSFFEIEYEKPCSVPSKLKLIPFNPFMKKLRVEDFGENAIRTFGGFRRFVVNRGTDFSAQIQEDITKGFSNGYTVTFISIQAAIYMGFTEIYLLGVDFDYAIVMDAKGNLIKQPGKATYFGGRSYDTSVLHTGPVLHAYQVAREYCDAHGIAIKNATRGGKLEVFERVDFDTLIERGGVTRKHRPAIVRVIPAAAFVVKEAA